MTKELDVAIGDIGSDIDDTCSCAKRFVKRMEALKKNMFVDMSKENNRIREFKCNKCGSYDTGVNRGYDSLDSYVICYNCGNIKSHYNYMGERKVIKCHMCNSTITRIVNCGCVYNHYPIWHIIGKEYMDVYDEPNFVCHYCRDIYYDEIGVIEEKMKNKYLEEMERIKQESMNRRLEELSNMTKDQLIEEVMRLECELDEVNADLDD